MTVRASSQSGALFGLDARIALAVFATLTIIIGYVSFGRIEFARQAAIIADIEAIENALAQLQTDMGVFLLFSLKKDEQSPSSEEDITALWSPAPLLPGFRDNWNGPYLHRQTRKHPTYGNFGLFYAQEDPGTTCTLESRCFVWLTLTQVPADTWREINSYYDEGRGKYPETSGQAENLGRVQADAATNPRTLRFRTRVERPRP